MVLDVWVEVTWGKLGVGSSGWENWAFVWVRVEVKEEDGVAVLIVSTGTRVRLLLMLERLGVWLVIVSKWSPKVLSWDKSCSLSTLEFKIISKECTQLNKILFLPRSFVESVSCSAGILNVEVVFKLKSVEIFWVVVSVFLVFDLFSLMSTLS